VRCVHSIPQRLRVQARGDERTSLLEAIEREVIFPIKVSPFSSFPQRVSGCLGQIIRANPVVASGRTREV